uniref:Homeobox domain-containing protein n=1 Tax=Brassica oleracea TaxID=3712 RepID=A0A3P6AXY0_BRAOL|nr:unnamed protein product [Brassica oleracea]
MMELDNQQQPNPMKVMTDEQLETLRKQIAIYATICERLVEMHKTLTSQQDLAAGSLPYSWRGRMVSLYADPSIGHKMTARQRWTPTPMQLQILERLFDQDTGTPSKQKIKDLTEQLSQHGQIAEQNICNWFQNRRARSKRKQHCGVGSSNNKNGEGEVEKETIVFLLFFMMEITTMSLGQQLPLVLGLKIFASRALR